MRLTMVLLAVAALAGPTKELPRPWLKWMNEDVVYIITDQERATLHRLKSNQEFEQFVVQFWLRRDPTRDTPENEFKEEHYRRIAYADDHFQSQIPGWKTDRGKVYIMLGAADEVTTLPALQSEDWHYRSIQGLGTEIVIRFVISAPDGEYRLNAESAEIVGSIEAPQCEMLESMGAFDQICTRWSTPRIITNTVK